MLIRRLILINCIFALTWHTSDAGASDWDEDPPARKAPGQAGPVTAAKKSSGKPLRGKIEKTHASKKQKAGTYGILDATEGSAGQEALSGSAESKSIDDELNGMVKDGSLKGLAPLSDQSEKLLQGNASLQGGKGTDPDLDDMELLVEWDRWHNRFLRAVQLGTQEQINNPDPEDYERPHVDPQTGRLSTRYPLGTGAAFSCQVTSDGQIKNLEIIEASGFPKYDRAVLRAVRQLEGTHILKFPKGSHRRTVIQPGRIKTATTDRFKYHHFGDVEKIRQ